jgi:hypothetical protein
VLDNPVQTASKKDLEVIFDARAESSLPQPDDPGYCIHLGESPLFDGFSIKINPDAFFGKHAAILGSTGAGKSCTIASLIQAILARDEVRRTNIIILDTNGEYRSAFQSCDADGNWRTMGARRCLYIPSDPQNQSDRIAIPYWFLNSDDFVRLFRAAANIQRPVLLDALRLSRSPSLPFGKVAQLRQILLNDIYRLIAQAEEPGKVSAEVEDIAAGCGRYLETQGDDLKELLGEDAQTLKQIMADIATKARQHVNEPERRRFSKLLPLDVQQTIKTGLQPILEKLTTPAISEKYPEASPDNPVYFSKEGFRRDHMVKAMQRDESGGSRARDYCATMLMRIYRLLEDKRFEFLFGPVYGEWSEPMHSLAAFLRDILGLPTKSKVLSPVDEVKEGLLPFYDRQRKGGDGHHIVILDLSLLAAEVLENVTALIGRLILEFLQRLGEHGVPDMRGSLPTVLVLEEAQNYIREQRFNEDESISRVVFERIAREGRKYGLSLVISSQRPSELSKTVLSQCSSFIVHRLQNPEDLRYFKEIVPAIYEALLAQVPALAPQMALVLGECVRAPALVRIRKASPRPRSPDPKFYEYWVKEAAPTVPVEEVCKKWEGK